jgi:hypothetical protein
MRGETTDRLWRDPLLRIALPLFLLPALTATYLTSANVSSTSERYALTTLIPGLLILSLLLGYLAEDRPWLSAALLVAFAVTPLGMVSPFGLNDTLPTLQTTPLRSPLLAFLKQSVRSELSPTDMIASFVATRLGSTRNPTLFLDWNPEGVLFRLPAVRIVRDVPFREPPRWIVMRTGSPTFLKYTLIGRVAVPPPVRSRYVLAARRPSEEADPDFRYIQEYVRSHPYRSVILHADLADDHVPEFFQHKFTPSDWPVEITLYEYTGDTLSRPAQLRKR